MFTFTLKVSNNDPVISCSSFATALTLSPWIIKSLHQVAWDNLPFSSHKLVYYRELTHQRRRRLQKRYKFFFFLLPLLNLTKKRDCSQSSPQQNVKLGTFTFWSRNDG